MGYNAEDEDLFSNKNKIVKDRYDNLRSELKNAIKNYNGINVIFDNSTASAYPYINQRQENTFIEQRFRDRKYIGYEEPSQINYEFTTPETREFDIAAGYYRITLIGAGSGGISINKIKYSGSKAGNAGGFLQVDVYFPTSGTLKYIVGKGSQGFIKYSGTPGASVTYGSDNGGDSEVYFNNILVARAYGGNKATISVFCYTFSWDPYEQSTGISPTVGGNVETYSYIKNVIQSYNGNPGNPYTGKKVRGNESPQICTPTYNVLPYSQYGVGGSAKASVSGQDCYANSGTNGYISITSIKGEDSFIDEEILVESNKIHTLGNENAIRRKLGECLNKAYDRIVKDTPLIEDKCNIIGEETNEETTCVPYSDSVLKNNPIKLFEVKKSGKNGYFSKDEYVVTYDFNTKRKLTINEYKNFLNNSMNNDVYTPFIYNNDIIYVKGIPYETSYIDIYKFENNHFIKQLNQGQFIRGGTSNWNSSNGELSKSITLNNDCIVVVSLVGGGGGGSGGSGGDHWFKKGPGGASGGYIKGSYRGLKNQTLTINVGTGGYGGRFGQKHSGEWGGTGGNSTLSLNGNIIMTAGAGTGGQGTSKHGHTSNPCGYAGINSYDNNYITVLTNRSGDGNMDGRPLLTRQPGRPSVYNGYGAGGNGGNNGKGDGISWSQSGLPGGNGYGEFYLYDDNKLIYNGNEYKVYEGSLTTSNVIYWSDYLYDLEKLNRLKEYLSTKDSWFDNDGYCQRSCQINCQTNAQT